MQDKFFFPLALLIAAIMVGGALLVDDAERLCGPVSGAAGPADYSKAIVEGNGLCRMEAGAEAIIDRLDEIGEPTHLRITAISNSPSSRVQHNAHFKLATDLATVYGGQKLRITVTARSAETADAQALEMNYSTGEAGETGWTRFDLKPGWNTYRLDYNVPEKQFGDGAIYNYLSIRPVMQGTAYAVDIQKIEFRRLGKWKEDE